VPQRVRFHKTMFILDDKTHLFAREYWWCKEFRQVPVWGCPPQAQAISAEARVLRGTRVLLSAAGPSFFITRDLTPPQGWRTNLIRREAMTMPTL